MNKSSVFYISLTGMTEPLGRSQVLEYLFDLCKTNKIFLLSFEREEHLTELEEVKCLIEKHNINWQYQLYSNKFGVFSTVFQLIKAYGLGSKLIKKKSISIVHSRSMIPATIGLLLKIRFKIKLLFDIRGFAIDEKVDSGRIKESSILFKVLKKLDNYLYQKADHIVTLTHKAKDIMVKQMGLLDSKITVIPTCASQKVFKVMDAYDAINFKVSLGYSHADKIIIHTGTVSGWYDFDSELKLLKSMMNQDTSIRFLMLNKSEHSFIKDKLAQYNLPDSKIMIATASFEDVHMYLNISLASLFFIKPSYSKQASAPTKFAENIACQLPSITNGNVGDMGFYLKKFSVGMIIDVESIQLDADKTSVKVLNYLNCLDGQNKSDYLKLFSQYFNKDLAVEQYKAIYHSLGRP